MSNNKKRQRRKRGDVVQIDLGNGYFGFGQVLESPLMAFFDLKTTDLPSIDKVLNSTVLFSIWVLTRAVTSGVWPVIGHAEVSKDINEHPQFFRRDRISGTLSIMFTGIEETPAAYEEVKDLECAAVWDPEHVVDRLNDHFAGRPNKWVESLRPQKPNNDKGG